MGYDISIRCDTMRYDSAIRYDTIQYDTILWCTKLRDKEIWSTNVFDSIFDKEDKLVDGNDNCWWRG